MSACYSADVAANNMCTKKQVVNAVQHLCAMRCKPLWLHACAHMSSITAYSNACVLHSVVHIKSICLYDFNHASFVQATEVGWGW